MEQMQKTPPREEVREEGRDLYEWVQALVCSVLTVVVVFTFGVRLIGVDGSSMVPTLRDGDRLLVLVSRLCGEYRRGDVVVLRKSTFLEEPIVKRVIAVGGETVDIDFDAGVVYVDGEALPEPYIREATHLAEGASFPQTVPEGCVFIMGDNRNDSRDSREPSLGAVDTRCLIGRAVFLLLPGQTAETQKREWSRIGSLA